MTTLAVASETDVHSARNMAGPPRLIREDSVTTAECPSCGARMSLGIEGARWTLRTPSDVADRLMIALGGLEREELHVLILDTKNHVLTQQRVYAGNVSASVVRVGELFSEAIKRCAPRIVIVHNHPSGDPTPSPDDVHLTTAAIAAGRLLDIEVLDHIVIGRTGFISLRDRGVAFDTSVPGHHVSPQEIG
jgi:DNA repair protein RadC